MIMPFYSEPKVPVFFGQSEALHQLAFLTLRGAKANTH